MLVNLVNLTSFVLTPLVVSCVSTTTWLPQLIEKYTRTNIQRQPLYGTGGAAYGVSVYLCRQLQLLAAMVAFPGSTFIKSMMLLPSHLFILACDDCRDVPWSWLHIAEYAGPCAAIVPSLEI